MTAMSMIFVPFYCHFCDYHDWWWDN